MCSNKFVWSFEVRGRKILEVYNFDWSWEVRSWISIWNAEYLAIFKTHNFKPTAVHHYIETKQNES